MSKPVKKVTKSTKRSYNANATRKRIMKAAEEEFSLYGLHGARVDRIALKARANKAMIYLYYNSKENLYKNVFTNIYSQIMQNEKLLQLDRTNLPELTEKLLLTYFDFHQRNPRFWRILAWANLMQNKAFALSDLQAIGSKTINHLQELYVYGQKQGLFKKEIDFSVYIFNIIAVCFFYHSNLASMSGTLGLDLKHPKQRQKLLKGLTKLLNFGIN